VNATAIGAEQPPDTFRFRRGRGIFGSVPDLIASIETYLAVNNGTPKPYVWTATAESILTKVQRARTTLDRVVTQ